ASAKRRDALLPPVACRRILPAILVVAGQLIGSLLAIGARFLVGCQLLVDLDEIEFIRQLKPLDPIGQFGDSLFIAERVQGIRARFVLLSVVVARRAAEKRRYATELHRLDTVHLLHEAGEL